MEGKRQLRLLGRVEIVGAAQPSLPDKARAMICLLARANGNRMPREYLADMLWSNSDHSRAQASLRQTLRQLRLALGQDVLQNIAGDVHLDTNPLSVDLIQLEAAWKNGSLQDVEEALRLFRGDFAEEVLVDGEPAQNWLISERALVRQLVSEAFLRAAEHHLEIGNAETAKRLSEQFLGVDPLCEQIQRTLIRALVALGRRAAAIEQYRIFRNALASELNVDPDPQTEKLLKSVLGKTGPKVAEQALTDVADRGADPETAAPTIAVLPIEELGEPSCPSVLGLGLAEELIVSLSGWRTFPVVAPASSLVALDRTLEEPTIGRLLNADYLVVSRLHYGSGRARLTSRLVESKTGQHVWAGSFELSLDDPLAAQEELSAKIASLVHQNTVQSEMNRIIWKRTSDLAAWELVVLGQKELQKLTRSGNATARNHFDAALEIDPDYVAAYVGIATSYCWDVQHVAKHDWSGPLRLAEEAAQRALQIDWNSPLAHTRLGAVYTWREDFDRGLAETELALHLNPSDAGTRLALGNRLDLVDQPEAGIAHMEKGLKLNPLEPRSALYLGYLARALLSTGQPERAREYAMRGIALRPNDAEMHLRLAACAANLSDLQGAQHALRACENIEKGFVSRRRNWQPYRDKERNEAVLEGLRRYELM